MFWTINNSKPFTFRRWAYTRSGQTGKKQEGIVNCILPEALPGPLDLITFAVY